LLKAEAQGSAPAAASPMTPEQHRPHNDKVAPFSWQITLRARGGVRRDAVREMVEQAIECDARRTGREADIERLAFDLDDRLKDIGFRRRLAEPAARDGGQMDLRPHGRPYDPSLWEEGGPNGPTDFWEMGGAELSGRRV
jgi:hypothetical protein